LEKGVPQSLKHGVSKSVITVRKKLRKFTQTDRRESRQQENEAKPSIQICHYGGSALLGFVRQARDRNLHLTREIINTKAKKFAEKLSNEP
jgi:hypothetical protein